MSDGYTIEQSNQLLNDAHDMLHRIVCVFVMIPSNDGAHKQATDLMQRIREHLGDEFDGRGRITTSDREAGE